MRLLQSYKISLCTLVYARTYYAFPFLNLYKDRTLFQVLPLWNSTGWNPLIMCSWHTFQSIFIHVLNGKNNFITRSYRATLVSGIMKLSWTLLSLSMLHDVIYNILLDCTAHTSYWLIVQLMLSEKNFVHIFCTVALSTMGYPNVCVYVRYIPYQFKLLWVVCVHSTIRMCLWNDCWVQCRLFKG